MGESINSSLDEINIFESPSALDKFYFTRSKKGIRGNYGIHYYSVDSNMVENTGQLNPEYDQLNEFLVDISADGKQLYFSRFFDKAQKFLLLEDYFIEGQAPLSNINKFDGPVEYAHSDRNLYLLNDSTFLFSSKKPSGYGGYDLYITAYRNNYWMKPINLGSQINSKYDETGPYLSKDGKTLFFSSNKEDAIGGFDIFRSTYLENKQIWSEAENLGLPVNSASDEVNFRLSYDGESAFMTSNRKEGGNGGFDLYRIFFRNSIENKALDTIPFLEHLNWEEGYLRKEREIQQAENIEIDVDTSGSYDFEDAIISTVKAYLDAQVKLPSKDRNTNLFRVKTIFFEKGGAFPDPDRSLPILHELTDFLKKNADVRVEFTVHTAQQASHLEDLIYSLQVANDLKVFMEGKKLDPERLSYVAAGSSFPIARRQVSKKLKRAAESYNNRIEIKLLLEDSEERILEEDPFVVHHLKDGKWLLHKSLLTGLSYKLKIAELNYLENAPFINELDNCIAVKNLNDSKNTVYHGLYKSYAQAKAAQESIRTSQQIESSILPFMNGQVIPEKDILELAKDYVDLVNYLENKDE